MKPFPKTADIQTTLQDYVDKYKKSVGVIIGLVSPTGTEIIPYGYLDASRTKPVQADTLFEIGSVSKIFTALLLADMVANGEVALDDPIGHFLPSTVKTPMFEGQPITLFHLATYTSGLPRNDNSHNPADRTNPYGDYSVEQLYDFLGSYALPHLPGAAAAYSNVGFGLLGHLLGLKTGQTFDQLIEQRIGRPLNMPDTTTTTSIEQNGRLAQPHNITCEPVPLWTLPTLAGAGALRSTMADMLQFIGGTLGLLSSSKAAALSPVMQDMAQTQYRTGEPDGKKRPLGWGIETKHQPHVFVADGGTGGSRAFVGFVPEKQIGIVILSNTANDIYRLGLNLLEPRYEPPIWELPRQEIELTAEEVAAYVGRYEEAETGDIYEVTNEGSKLFVQIIGEGRFQVYPETPNEFFYKIADAQHIFLRNDKGQVTTMLTRQFGQERPAKRIESPTSAN